MNHKSKFKILALLIISVIMFYSWDIYTVIEDINYNAKQIDAHNYQLSQTDIIREKIESFQHAFLKFLVTAYLIGFIESTFFKISSYFVVNNCMYSA